ncbi:hypothetical protein NE237_026284 [Protea cynaroides]|uniref:Uncharacterized protein n=1 Tax=Protea cynaroides TaxID=273540 RepID=A0A9Q0H3Y6_9MAGN|nr:hypothetical protein NE237_026284 [Protea cynaroides]
MLSSEDKCRIQQLETMFMPENRSSVLLSRENRLVDYCQLVYLDHHLLIENDLIPIVHGWCLLVRNGGHFYLLFLITEYLLFACYDESIQFPFIYRRLPMKKQGDGI